MKLNVPIEEKVIITDKNLEKVFSLSNMEAFGHNQLLKQVQSLEVSLDSEKAGKLITEHSKTALIIKESMKQMGYLGYYSSLGIINALNANLKELLIIKKG